ncbi:MAG TPA: hypothetical protein VG405_00610 [Solirubrobacteraceae bacterium]|jgi:hypothetical protein|nr:hypothetical protein [Solirubrobacteraceae bacterium]
MQGAFTYVIWVVAGVGILIAVVAAASSGKVWEEIGRDRLVRDTERSSNTDGRSGGLSAAGLAERDIEIRQMLQARNDRRARRGEAALDVESELQRLTAPAVDDELRDEIRHLVVARNHRRVRRGEPPLDVESEVERRVAELGSDYSRPTSS